jgi:hypothetical protein
MWLLTDLNFSENINRIYIILFLLLVNIFARCKPTISNNLGFFKVVLSIKIQKIIFMGNDKIFMK